MADIRINQLPLATGGTAPAPSDVVALDGTTTRKAPLSSLGDVVRPFASQAEAEAGTNNTKTMTPLTTAQAIDALAATEAQGAKADTAMQPTVYDPRAIGGDAFPYGSKTEAASANIATALNTVYINGLGPYSTVNNGSTDTFVSADGRTWYRSLDISVNRLNLPLLARLPRPDDLYRMDGQTYMRFMCKGTGDNPMGRAVGMAIDEVGRNLFMFFVTNSRIHRFDLDGPPAARSLDYMDCGSILGHQTMGVEYVVGGGIRLWAPSVTPGRVLRMTYVAGGAPTTQEYIVHENEGDTNYTSLTISHDGRYLVCSGSEGDNRPIKVFELSKLIAGGPGDYRTAWLHKWEIPAYLRETDQSLQAIASDGSVAYMISGRGALLSYDNKRGICDIQTGELLQVIDSKVGITDATGVDGNNVNEPEGADMMAGDDGTPALVTFNLAGGADARNSFRVYVSGRRPSPAAVASSVTTRLVSAMSAKPTALRQFLIESVVRELAAADVWNRLSWLHLANFDAASSRLNWMDPRWGALVDDGVSGSIGFLADRGFNVATAGKSLIFDVGPRSAPNLEYISAHYGGILLGNDLGATIMALAAGTQVLVQPRSAGGNWASRHNCSNTSSETNADSNGHYIINRLIASEYTKWKNGSLFATEAEPATTFSTNTMRYMSGSPSGIRLVAGHAGMGLDNTRRQALEAALLRYRTEIGAI